MEKECLKKEGACRLPRLPARLTLHIELLVVLPSSCGSCVEAPPNSQHPWEALASMLGSLLATFQEGQVENPKTSKV